MKRQESAQRIRYTRELGRYLSRIASLLEERALEQERFFERVDAAYKRLEAIEPVALYSSHYAQTLELVNTLTARLEQLRVQPVITPEERCELGQWLAYQLNQLEKSRRRSSYSRKKQSKDQGWE